MNSFCLLASTELIRIPNWSLAHLHSIDTNVLKCLAMKKKINCYNKSRIKSEINLCKHAILYN